MMSCELQGTKWVLTGSISVRMTLVLHTGFPNFAHPTATYASDEAFFRIPKPGSPALKFRPLLILTIKTPRVLVSFLKSSPTSMSFRSSVKLFGATYSASAASIELCTKDEMSGKSMRLSPLFVNGTQERSALGCPRKVKVQSATNGGSGHLPSELASQSICAISELE